MAPSEGGVLMMKVAIFGASGFVGEATVARLSADDRYEVRPVIHTSGSAWGLARRGMRLWSADLGSREQLREAVRGCDAVVNCAWPPAGLMVPGLRNLMKTCLSEGIKRFVHISSSSVYGEPPPPESTSEDARPRPVKGTYPWYKLRQDQLVEQFHRKGLSSVVLCPPNISGPNSRYILMVLDALRDGSLILVDDGSLPCVLGDVTNLAAAIELALTAEGTDGRRMFVTDDEPVTWRDLVDALMPLADGAPAPDSITSAEAQAFLEAQGDDSLSLPQAVKAILRLPQTREALKRSALAQRMHRTARWATGWLPGKLAGRVKALMQGRGPIAQTGSCPSWSAQLVTHQLRKVRHSCDRCKSQLGYMPPLTFDGSMTDFRRWYEVLCGSGSKSWPLLRELYPHADRARRPR